MRTLKLNLSKEFSFHCRGCTWSGVGKSRSAAATHVRNTGHSVEVYWEVGRVIKAV